MKNILIIIGFFIIGALGGVVGNTFFTDNTLSNNYQSANISVPVIEQKEVVIEENILLEESIKKIESSIIGIKTKTKSGKMLSGSGLVVTSDGLIIVFSDLLVQGGDFVVDGKIPDWQILKKDKKSNLALVKVELNNLTTVAFNDDIRLGQKVFTIGTLFTNAKSFKSVNEGIIKFFDDQKIETNIIEKEALTGGALFNIKGELLGLIKINADNTVSAIRASKIKEFLGY